MTASDNFSSGNSRFEQIVAAFLAAPKASASRMSWRSKAHPDYTRSQVKIICESMPRVRSRVVMLSHTYLLPRKYSFALLFGSERIASLDINPRRSHRNALQRVSVSSTHWSFYPCDLVDPDERQLIHFKWLDEFCQKCNIDFRARYEHPPHGYEQIQMKLSSTR